MELVGLWWACHQKRVVEFGEWLCTDVLKYVPHRQWVFSIPKRLRIYFMFDRSLLANLSRCAWKVLNLYLTQAVPYDDAKAGAAVAVQNFGDFQNFIPIYMSWPPTAAFRTTRFMVCRPPDTGSVKRAFEQAMLLWLIENEKNKDFKLYFG